MIYQFPTIACLIELSRNISDGDLFSVREDLGTVWKDRELEYGTHTGDPP